MHKSIEFHFKAPEESPGFLLWQVSMIWQRQMKRALDEINLTHTQFVLLAALAWLSKENTAVTQVDIANYSNTDRMMVSKVLRTLQDKGFITRIEHKTDTRAKVISLSISGQVVFKQAIKIVERTDSEFFSVLNTKEENFKSNMRKLIQSDI